MIFSWVFNLLALFFFVRSGLPATVNPDLTLLNQDLSVKAPLVEAQRSAVLDKGGRFYFWSARGDETQPIASITKLMTALVFLENNPGWDTPYQVTADDHITGGHLNLFLGDRVTVKDLFMTSLVASDNGATMALVHATGLSETDFVKKMNEKAQALGLLNTHFVDPVGLSDGDESTAREVTQLAKAALSRPEISQATESQSYDFTTLGGKAISIASTDELLTDTASGSLRILGGKTGYTDQAGYCFVGRFQAPDGREVIAAVLNAVGKNDRFTETESLANWVFKSFKTQP